LDNSGIAGEIMMFNADGFTQKRFKNASKTLQKRFKKASIQCLTLDDFKQLAS